MTPYLNQQYANPGSLHKYGRMAKEAIERARASVARLINCSPDNIFFTSGGTEANNMVVFGLVDYFIDKNKHNIISSEIEHDSIRNAINRLCSKDAKNPYIKHGFYNTLISTLCDGRVDIEKVIDLINEDTGLVTTMMVNNETGVSNDIVGLSRICGEKGVLLHTDAVQALSSLDVNIDNLNVDFLTLSAHKIHAPKGVGAIYIKNPRLLTPVIIGGDEQEQGLRGGTENVPGIVGFGKACDILTEDADKKHKVTLSLKAAFKKELVNSCRKYNIEELIHTNSDSGSIFNFRIDNIDSQTLILMLDSMGVCVSAGSACRSLDSEPSHVLTAMGLSANDARSSIRVSFSSFNTQEDMLKAAQKTAYCAYLLSGGAGEI